MNSIGNNVAFSGKTSQPLLEAAQNFKVEDPEDREKGREAVETLQDKLGMSKFFNKVSANEDSGKSGLTGRAWLA